MRAESREPANADPKAGLKERLLESSSNDSASGAREPLDQDSQDPAEIGEQVIAFAIKLFRALHQYGTPTYRLEQMMRQVSARLGLQGQFFSLPTGIFLSFGAPEEQRSTLIRVEPSSVDLGKLGLLHDLTRRVVGGHIGTSDGTVEVDRITCAPPSYGRFLTVVAYGLASGVGPAFFGGGWREVAVAGAIGVCLGLLSLIVSRSEDASRVFEALAAVLASALATLGAHVLNPVSVYVATLSGLLVLFPGFTLTVAIRELATRNLVSGTAQLTGATVTFLELAFGVALGSQIGRVLPPVHIAHHAAPLGWWAQWVALAIAPLAFAVLLKARRKDLIWVLLAGVVGFTGTRLGASLVGPELGAFIGALLLGMGSNIYGRAFNRTSMVPLVPGLLLLVPGSLGFGSLSRFLQSDVVSGLETAFKMVLIATSLVTGLLVANVLIRPRDLPEST